MDKKERILDLYFNKHLKQKEIADITNTSQQYISKTINESELNKLFEISKNDPLKLIILITAFYGLRRSEVKNNMRHIRFHDLRHSCASLLLAKNIPMKSIQEWLGHSNFSTTANF